MPRRSWVARPHVIGPGGEGLRHGELVTPGEPTVLLRLRQFPEGNERRRPNDGEVQHEPVLGLSVFDEALDPWDSRDPDSDHSANIRDDLSRLCREKHNDDVQQADQGQWSEHSKEQGLSSLAEGGKDDEPGKRPSAEGYTEVL